MLYAVVEVLLSATQCRTPSRGMLRTPWSDSGPFVRGCDSVGDWPLYVSFS